MPLPDPNVVYGIHSITPMNKTTQLPFGILLVLGSANMELTGEQEKLYGGSNKYSWATENKTINTQFTCNVKSYEDFMFELFLGATITTFSAEANGNVSTITNVNGTSVVNSTTGIASVALTGSDQADLKMGKVIVAGTAVGDEVDVYYSTNLDFKVGTDVAYDDASLTVDTAITIPGSSATVASADLGLTFTGGSGSISITDGDTAEFYVRPVNAGGFIADIGSSASTFPSFSALIYASKRGNGDRFEIEAYNCQGIGMPINLSETAFSVADLTVSCDYDSAKDGVMRIRSIKGV